MPRHPRIERAGAWPHVTARGLERRAIYRDERDRARFCRVLGESVQLFRWRLHADVLMDNHYHLLVETSAPNLGRGMQRLNTSDGVWFNRRHERAGHLLQNPGRCGCVIWRRPVGLDEVAVSMAARRAPMRAERNRALAAALDACQQKLQMLNV